jgi:antitoxin CcdA
MKQDAVVSGTRVPATRSIDAGTTDAAKIERDRQWREDNRDWAESVNRWVEQNGLPLEKYRRF